MSERDFHAEAIALVTELRGCTSERLADVLKEYPRGNVADLVRECERRLRGDDLIRQMLEMSKEEGLVDFYGWIKAAEKYLEGK